MSPALPLVYSSPWKRQEYRASASPGLEPAPLLYDWRLPGTGVHAPQARLEDRLILTPPLIFRGQISVSACIDRIGLLLRTERPLPPPGLATGLHRKLGARAYLHRHWEAPEDSSLTFMFLQDVTPLSLQNALEFIHARWRLQGDPDLLLLEVALDFRPRTSLTPDLQLELREQMVGLLQRHHHLDGARLFAFPGSDARSHHGLSPPKDPREGRTVRLFSTPKKTRRSVPDHEVTFAEVRDRIGRSVIRERLFLDGTLYRGSQEENLLIRIQHKIRDQQIPAAGTYRLLPPAERRARLEVDIRGQALSRHLGLTAVSQLGGYDFRRVQKAFFQLRCATTPDTLVAKRLLVDEFTLRGLYGTEAKERLRRLDAGASDKRRGHGPSGTTVTWHEAQEAVRKAIAALSKKWGAFSWKGPAGI